MLGKAILILTMLGVSANSATASLLPCCCTQQAERAHAGQSQAGQSQAGRAVKHVRACCEKPPVEQSPCCAEKAAARQLSMTRQSCCCVTSVPAVPAARVSFASASVKPVQDALAGNALCPSDSPPAKDRVRQAAPGRLRPASPPVMALYCIWLK